MCRLTPSKCFKYNLAEKWRLLYDTETKPINTSVYKHNICKRHFSSLWQYYELTSKRSRPVELSHSGGKELYIKKG